MRKKITILAIISLLGILMYLFIWIVSQYKLVMLNLSDPARQSQFIKTSLVIIKNRGVQVIALLIASILISMSTLTFQTLTANKIVTPSLLGLDAIYVVIQTTLVFVITYFQKFINNPLMNLLSDSMFNFILSVVVMSGFTILLYTFMLKKHKKNLLLLLLVGMVISTLAANYSTFLQILMDPEAFQTVASLTSVSVVNIDVSLTFISLPLTVLLFILFYKKSNTYDVMSLGENHAKNLGVKYNDETYKSLILISVAISITTALVGPLSFLGLIAVNLSREAFKKYQHKIIFITSILISMIFLIFGQAVIELTGYKTTVTTIINLMGGLYMIKLIMKEHKI